MRLLKHAYWSLASWGTPPIEQFNYTTDSDGAQATHQHHTRNRSTQTTEIEAHTQWVQHPPLNHPQETTCHTHTLPPIHQNALAPTPQPQKQPPEVDFQPPKIEICTKVHNALTRANNRFPHIPKHLQNHPAPNAPRTATKNPEKQPNTPRTTPPKHPKRHHRPQNTTKPTPKTTYRG